ncbi:MAG: hypothetical protein J5981_00730 [Lachnospira sp.]|nr:hypothetical protein [Lachnospira sp.]
MNKKYVTYIVIISLLLVCIGTAYAGRSFEQEKLRQESKLQKINEAYNGRDSFFVASWSENRAYEYAVADDTEQTITCIYTQLKRPDEVTLTSEYMIKESEVLEKIPEKFSIYYFKTGNQNYVLPELSESKIKSTIIGL